MSEHWITNPRISSAEKQISEIQCLGEIGNNLEVKICKYSKLVDVMHPNLRMYASGKFNLESSSKSRIYITCFSLLVIQDVSCIHGICRDVCFYTRRWTTVTRKVGKRVKYVDSETFRRLQDSLRYSISNIRKSL